jgi:hypothetical protein
MGASIGAITGAITDTITSATTGEDDARTIPMLTHGASVGRTLPRTAWPWGPLGQCVQGSFMLFRMGLAPLVT